MCVQKRIPDASDVFSYPIHSRRHFIGPRMMRAPRSLDRFTAVGRRFTAVGRTGEEVVSTETSKKDDTSADQAIVR